MTILEMLHEIDEKKCIYNIHYCKAGVGFSFYDPELDHGNWRDALVVHGYAPTFEEAVQMEYARLGKKGSKQWNG